MSDRPPYRRPGYLAVVGAGGAVGAAFRYLITELAAPAWSQPVATMIINVIGSLLLGLLLEALARRGPDRGRRRTVRLLVGTGMLGGFTTYSTLALDDQQLLRSGHPMIMVGYALGTVLLGVLAAGCGVLLGTRHRRRRA